VGCGLWRKGRRGGFFSPVQGEEEEEGGGEGGVILYSDFGVVLEREMIYYSTIQYSTVQQSTVQCCILDCAQDSRIVDRGGLPLMRRPNYEAGNGPKY
jgi:hypothetical protein